MSNRKQGGLGRLARWPVSASLACILSVVAIVSPLALYVPRIRGYAILGDDFYILRDGASFERMTATLWEPLSTHVCPPFRLLTWALFQLAPRLTVVPDFMLAGSLMGLLLLLAALHTFVKRETESPFLGLLAVVLGGMTSAYYPAVGRYSCSQSLWAVAFTMLTLLGVQAFRRRPRRSWIATSFVCAFLAPAWFSQGLIAGPVGSLYAWMGLRERTDIEPVARRLAVAAPFVGSLAFALLVLWMSGEALLAQPRLAGSGGQTLTAWQAFRPDLGAYLAARGVTELVLLWSVGSDVPLGIYGFLGALSGLLVFGVVWYRRGGHRALAAAGLALLVLGAWFVFSFEAAGGIRFVRWGRWYLVFAHVGWVLFVCSGVYRRPPAARRPLTLGHVVALTALATVLFALHREPARIRSEKLQQGDQRRDLRRLEIVRDLSRRLEVAPEAIARLLPLGRVHGAGVLDVSFFVPRPERVREWDPEELRARVAAELDAHR